MQEKECKPTMIYHHCTQATDAQGIHIYEICQAFKKLGWNVEKVALAKEEVVVTKKHVESSLSWVHKLPTWLVEIMKICYNLRDIGRLWKAVRTHKPSFIYERYSMYNIAGVIVAFWTKIPIAIEINSPLVYEQKIEKKLFWERLAQGMETWIVSHSTKTIAVTHVLKDMLIKAGADPERIVVIPNGINIEEYPEEKYGRILKDRLQKIAFVGWFRDWHRLPELIDALNRKKIFEQGTQLYLIGDGPARPEIKKAIQENKLESQVIITGSLSRQEVIEKLADIDIAIQPAANIYACPMKLIEYMAAGRAIIAPKLPNIEEILQDKVNAIFFTDGDWDDFANKILYLMENPTLAKQLGQNARQAILQRPYTWTHNAKQTLEILEIPNKESHK